MVRTYSPQLTTLYEAHWLFLVRYLRAYSRGNNEVAADLAQNCFLRVLRMPPEMLERLVSSDPNRQRGFLVTLARWEALSLWRDIKRRGVVVTSLDDEVGRLLTLSLADAAPLPERETVAKEEWTVVDRVIGECAGTERQALILRLWARGSPVSELAKQFEMTPRRVMTAIVRLRARVRSAVAKDR